MEWDTKSSPIEDLIRVCELYDKQLVAISAQRLDDARVGLMNLFSRIIGDRFTVKRRISFNGEIYYELVGDFLGRHVASGFSITKSEILQAGSEEKAVLLLIGKLRVTYDFVRKASRE